MTITGTNGNIRSSRDAARHYLRCGVVPVPNKAHTKQPGNRRWDGSDWNTLHVTDDDVDRLFDADGNIGLALGARSGGLVDVDLDSPEAIAAASHLLPRTGLVGGRASAPRSHHWYTVENPPAKASDKFRDPLITDSSLNVLLELRSTGGQSIVAPSVYGAEPEKGHPVAEPSVWAEHGEPARVDIGVLATAVRGVAAASLLGRYWPRGSRHDASLALAGGLLRAGWLEEAVERFVRAVCAAARDEELEDRIRVIRGTADRLREGKNATGFKRLIEVLGERGRAVMDAVGKWLALPRKEAGPGVTFGGEGATKPAPPPPGWEPPVPLPDPPAGPDFSLDLFPPALSDYWAAAASMLHVPVDYVACPALSILGAAVGRARAAEVKDGYAQSPLFWIVVIAPPGSAKSPALSAAAAPLHAEEARWRKEHADLMVQYKAAVHIYEAQLKDWKKDPTTGDAPAEPPRPTLRQSALDDTTAEGARRVLAENPRGVLVLMDELISFVRGLNQYKSGGKGTDKAFWLTGWNGSGVSKSNRAGTHEKGPIITCDPFTAVGGMMCPDSIAELREELQRGGSSNDGWADRFLLVYPPPPRAVEESWATVPAAVATGYGELVRAVLALDMVPVNDPEREASFRPFFSRFDAGARKVWGALTREVARRINTLPPSDAYRGVLSKLKHYVVRFASLFHSVWSVSAGGTAEGGVGEASVKRAVRLVWYFEEHGRRCLGVGGQEVQAARQLLLALARWEGDAFTARQLHQKVRGQSAFRKAANLDTPLRELVSHGFVREVEPAPGGRGRPSERYLINPLWNRAEPETPQGTPPQYPQNAPNAENPGTSDDVLSDARNASEYAQPAAADAAGDTRVPAREGDPSLLKTESCGTESAPQNGTNSNSSGTSEDIESAPTGDVPGTDEFPFEEVL